MREISERLRDIQEAIVRILKYTNEGRERYDNDELVIDAILEKTEE